MILMGPFQFEIFYDSTILWFYELESIEAQRCCDAKWLKTQVMPSDAGATSKRYW